MTYSTYEGSCSGTQLCDPSVGLTCPSTASGCNCPTTLAANKCDCPTTHYWDTTSLACLVRVSNNGACTVGKDYMCKHFIIYV